MAEPVSSATTAALGDLRRYLPEINEVLGLGDDPILRQWQVALDMKLLPRLDDRFPLVAAVCGGGSAGKSTLFNSLIGRALSPTGGRAGLNRRVLAAVAESQIKQPGFLQALTHAFEDGVAPMTDARQLTTPGRPLYWSGTEALTNVVLLDTPDIDTGARGEYHNREQARQSMESADLFIYIFTNATYNNRDNTDFISHMFTGMGVRPCYLVYRVYPAYDSREVTEHAVTVARNIYGKDFEQHILGIFRADEDNSVAAGLKPLDIRSMTNGQTTLKDALGALNSSDLRADLIRSMTDDAISQAEKMLRNMAKAQAELDRYLSEMENTQAQSVQRALAHFPTDRVLGRFADIWLTTDPTHIKIMRRTGQVVEWPFKTLTYLVGRLRDQKKSKPEPTADTTPEAQLDIDLLEAATYLYQQAVGDHIDLGQASIPAPALVQPAQDKLRHKDWKSTLTLIQEQRETILSWSSQLEHDLGVLAAQLRSRMGVWDRMRQTFAALLNVLPATAAVTYVLSTGDPVGATGIKIKLTGLLGLKDLYALIAIPATAGLKKADQKQLVQLLEPVARTWLAYKITQVQTLFEEQITGELLSDARNGQANCRDLMDKAAQSLAQAKEAQLK